MLRAELLERGWDAQCAPNLRGALALMTRGAMRSPVEVLLVDTQALTEWEPPMIRALAAIDGGLALVLLAGASEGTPSAPWRRVVRKPVGVPRLVEQLQQVYAARAKASAPASVEGPPLAFRIRRGDPWPVIACAICGKSRHFMTPARADRVAGIRAEMLSFALEHSECLAPPLSP